MDDGQARKVSLNGPLVEQAQATLARMRVAERAYTLLKSEAHNAEVEDWLASQRGGPDMNLVFEAANGANLDTIRVPGFFTYDGFYSRRCSRICRRSATSCKRTIGCSERPATRTPCSSSSPVSIPAFSSSTAATSSPPGRPRSTIFN